MMVDINTKNTRIPLSLVFIDTNKGKNATYGFQTENKDHSDSQLMTV